MVGLFVFESRFSVIIYSTDLSYNRKITFHIQNRFARIRFAQRFSEKDPKISQREVLKRRL